MMPKRACTVLVIVALACLMGSVVLAGTSLGSPPATGRALALEELQLRDQMGGESYAIAVQNNRAYLN